MIQWVKSKIRFWNGGPLFRNVSGVIEARNAADSAYAIVRGGTPSGNNDLGTKSYVDTAIDTDITAAFKDSTFQDSTDPTKEATLDLSGITTATERTIVIPDEDITLGSFLDPTFKDSTDQTKEATLDLSGITTATERTITVPDKDITLAGTVDVAAAELSKIECRCLSLAYTDTGDNNIGSVVPDGASVLAVFVSVGTTFDGTTPTLKVGDAGDDDRLATYTSTLSSGGVSSAVWQYTNYASSTQLVANLVIGGTPSQGACDLVVLFARASS